MPQPLPRPPQAIRPCPASGDGPNFYGDIEYDEYLPFAVCRCCLQAIMLICAPGCTGSHDYMDAPPCTLILAPHSSYA